MSVKGAAYDVMRRLASPGVRRWIKNQAWFVPVSKRLFGSEVYSDSYFRDIERIEAASVETIAAWIVDRIGPGRAIDIGCGPGHMMKALVDRGVDMVGVDIAEAGLARVRDKGLDGQAFDLTREAPLPGIPYDLAISCEVAEHLDERHADRFVAHLTSASDTVYLTAAEPDPSVGPGLHHVNERPNAYWIDKLASAGFVLDEALTGDARSRFGAGVIVYLAKPMIFTRTG